MAAERAQTEPAVMQAVAVQQHSGFHTVSAAHVVLCIYSCQSRPGISGAASRISACNELLQAVRPRVAVAFTEADATSKCHFASYVAHQKSRPGHSLR